MEDLKPQLSAVSMPINFDTHDRLYMSLITKWLRSQKRDNASVKTYSLNHNNEAKPLLFAYKDVMNGMISARLLNGKQSQ